MNESFEAVDLVAEAVKAILTREEVERRVRYYPELLAILEEALDWLTGYSEWGYDVAIKNNNPRFSYFIKRAKATIEKAREVKP